MATAADHTPSRGCYQRGCRLPECDLENYRYYKQLQVDHLRGERRIRDATQVRAHIERLIANKWWEAEIARAAGINKTTIGNIRGGQAGVSRRIALSILAIPVVEISRTERGERQDATGSIRRLKALAVIGHTWATISARTGISVDRLGGIVRGITDGIRPDEARKITLAYRLLATTPGAGKKTATNARKKGWHGPLAWDNIDDPNCQPETEHRASRARAGTRPKVYADATRVAELTAAGKSAAEIALELGCHQRTVVRARGRMPAEAVAA
ncbi:hypothetical protein AB0I27_22965 [Streptomyces sp. NPDC050597]|uniref:hypothetical protein n=1 Tax=Streptomyces sp. NPDC050597 TaxID=3157212 RepID=UPI003446E8CD